MLSLVRLISLCSVSSGLKEGRGYPTFDRHRSLVTKIIAVLALLGSCSQVLAIGLGELSHDTKIGQRLSATIPIVGAEIGQAEGLIVKQLMSQEAEKLGLQGIFSPYRVSSTLEIDQSGVPRAIHIKTNKPITEPFINIIIQVTWPEGRVFREFSLLFNTPSIESRANTSPSRKVGQQLRSVQEADFTLPKSQASYRVKVGDTLSAIVRGLELQEGLSQASAIQILLASNPKAFLTDSANSLKAGSLLNVSVIEGSLDTLQLIKSEHRSLASTKQGEKTKTIDKPIEKINELVQKKLEGHLTLSSGGILKPDTVMSAQTQLREKIDGTHEMLDLIRQENFELRERIEKIESSNYIGALTEIVAIQQKKIEKLRLNMAGQSFSFAQTAKSSAGESVPGTGLDLTRKAPTDSGVDRHLWFLVAFFALASILFLVAYIVWRISNNRRATNVPAYSSSTSSQYIDIRKEPTLREMSTRSNRHPKTDENKEQETDIPSVPLNDIKPEDVDTFSANVMPMYRPSSESKDDEKNHSENLDAPVIGPKHTSVDIANRQPDELVKARIKEKTQEYNHSVSVGPSIIRQDLVIDEFGGLDEEVNELLSMAQIYCSAGKYSEARAILTAQQQMDNDTRLIDAIDQINQLEREKIKE